MQNRRLILNYGIAAEASVINTNCWHTVDAVVEPRRKRTSDEEEQRRRRGRELFGNGVVSVAWRGGNESNVVPE